MCKQKLTLVTGQSGTAIKKSLEKLGYKYCSVEDTIKNISNIPLNEFFTKPLYIQYRLWEQAFLSIIKNEINNKGIDILTFHASYYHQTKREQFSPVNIRLIFEILKENNLEIDKVIVFIDDIYDVLKRLMDKGQMFDHLLDKEKFSKKDAIYQAIFSIITLLQWREIEICTSRMIANIFKSNIYIIATKHPTFMIKRIFERKKEDLQIFYLSHPISEIRRIARNRLANFIGELNLLIRYLLQNENVVIFYPTSIDEKIIEQKTISHKNYFIPQLGQRWDLPYADKQLLCVEIKEELNTIPPLNPQHYNLKKNDYEKISRCLELLDKFIHQRQILSRDYSLVEQCRNGVIAIRPYFNGERSDGMINELEHNFQLMKKDKTRSFYVFTTLEDNDKYKIEKFIRRFVGDNENILKNVKRKWIKEEFILRKKRNPEILQKLKNEVVGQDFDFTKIQTIDNWRGDYLGKKSIAEQQVIKTLRHEINKDEIGKNIKELKDKTRTTYKFIDDANIDQIRNFLETYIT